MDKLEILTKTWGLRQHPFDSTIAPEEHKGATDLFEASLDPNKDIKALDFLHDIYDWGEASYLSNDIIGQVLEGSSNFLANQNDLPSPDGSALFIIVAGTNLSGRRSLLNFIKYRFKKESPAGNDPLFLDLKLSSANGKENTKNVAKQIRYQYQRRDPDVKEDFRDIFADIEDETAKVAPFYTSLFNNMKFVMDNQIPIVAVLDGTENFNVWIEMYESLKKFCDLVLMVTRDEKVALRCKNTMVLKQLNVSLVIAPNLKEPSAINYLKERLARIRLVDHQPPNAIWPYTEQAVNALFKVSNINERSTISWSIHFLNRSLRMALDVKINNLHNMGIDTTLLSSDQLLITESDIMAAREEINQLR